MSGRFILAVKWLLVKKKVRNGNRLSSVWYLGFMINIIINWIIEDANNGDEISSLQDLTQFQGQEKLRLSSPNAILV